MKTLYSVALVSLLTIGLTTPVLADDRDPAAGGDQSRAEEAELLEQRQAKLAELTARMDREMEAIYAANDPEKRARLMKAHRQTMREALALTADMGGEGMKETMMAHLDAGTARPADRQRRIHAHKRNPPIQRSDTTSLRMDRLETRVEMMQIILEDMLEYVGSSR